MDPEAVLVLGDTVHTGLHCRSRASTPDGSTILHQGNDVITIKNITVLITHTCTMLCVHVCVIRMYAVTNFGKVGVDDLGVL